MAESTKKETRCLTYQIYTKLHDTIPTSLFITKMSHYRDGVMLLLVYLCCVMTPCFFLLLCFEPFLSLWRYSTNFYSTLQSHLHGYFVGWQWTNSNLLKAVAMAEAGCNRHPQRQCIVSYKRTWIRSWHFWTEWCFQGQALAILLQC